MARARSVKPKNPKIEEMRQLFEMLRDCGVLEYSNEGIQVKLLPKSSNQSLQEAMPDLMSDGLMGETVEKLARSREDYDKDLFWSR